MWKEETAIGMIYLFPAGMILRHATLGIDLLPEFQQQGYGTEAVRAALDYLEASSNLTKISAGCFSDNLGACRTYPARLRKAGVRPEFPLAFVICVHTNSSNSWKF